jgi:hypothetical protein
MNPPRRAAARCRSSPTALSGESTLGHAAVYSARVLRATRPRPRVSSMRVALNRYMLRVRLVVCGTGLSRHSWSFERPRSPTRRRSRLSAAWDSPRCTTKSSAPRSRLRSSSRQFDRSANRLRHSLRESRRRGVSGGRGRWGSSRLSALRLRRVRARASPHLRRPRAQARRPSIGIRLRNEQQV